MLEQRRVKNLAIPRPCQNLLSSMHFRNSWPRGVRSTLPLTALPLFSASGASRESISKQSQTENYFHTCWREHTALRSVFYISTCAEHAFDSCWCVFSIKTCLSVCESWKSHLAKTEFTQMFPRLFWHLWAFQTLLWSFKCQIKKLPERNFNFSCQNSSENCLKLKKYRFLHLSNIFENFSRGECFAPNVKIFKFSTQLSYLVAVTRPGDTSLTGIAF